MLGFAVLALAVDWIAGDAVDIGFGRLTALLILGGLTISAPYGIGWLRGEHREPAPDEPLPVQRVDGTPGATYLVLHQADAQGRIRLRCHCAGRLRMSQSHRAA